MRWCKYLFLNFNIFLNFKLDLIKVLTFLIIEMIVTDKLAIISKKLAILNTIIF
jgi:hypothetical protein